MPLYKYFTDNLSQGINEHDKTKLMKTLGELSAMRSEALKTKGEMSTENWIYKELRCDDRRLFQKALTIIMELDV